MSTYTGENILLMTVRFFGPPCTYTGLFVVHFVLVVYLFCISLNAITNENFTVVQLLAKIYSLFGTCLLTQWLRLGLGYKVLSGPRCKSKTGRQN